VLFCANQAFGIVHAESTQDLNCILLSNSMPLEANHSLSLTTYAQCYERRPTSEGVKPDSDSEESELEFSDPPAGVGGADRNNAYDTGQGGGAVGAQGYIAVQGAGNQPGAGYMSVDGAQGGTNEGYVSVAPNQPVAGLEDAGDSDEEI
jgi:hypothetical protein